MVEYSEIELREMISNLRIVKTFASRLVDEDEVRLTKFELLLENHTNNKYKEIDEWLNKLINKNGTTEI
jgi:hypothetical protein